MSIYNVALADLGSGLSPADKNQIAQNFGNWLRLINNQTHPHYARIVVNWVTNANSANGTHLMIYFVQSAVQSVIVNAPNYNQGVRDFAGMTLLLPSGSPGLSASEVYVSEHNGDLNEIFITVIHEAMHNQRQQGNSMHSLGGAAASPGTAPTPENIIQMAERFHYYRRQWIGGFQALQNLNINLSSNSIPGINAP
jgi:hypothetical protein